MRTRRALFQFALLASFLILVLGFGRSVFSQTAEEEQKAGDIYVMRIQGPISPGSAGFLQSALDQAVEGDAQALIVELDTPGGLAESMRIMVKAIMNAPLPVVVYVSPTGAQAASAGVMVTMAADVAAMAPGSNIGAAHPVAAGGKDIDGEMAKKVLNDMVAFTQGIAKERGRNVGWAKMAVERSVSITADEAVKINVVDLIADNRSDLIKKINGWEIKRGGLSRTIDTTGAAVVVLEESLRDKILKTLANPNIAYILMMIGLAGLYFELSHPGAILPGVVGGISLVLAFYSFHTLPVNYAGIAMLILGIILFILEIKVTSYGMLSVGGLLCFTLGGLMLFESPEGYMRVSLNVLIPVTVFIGGFFVFVTSLVIKAHRNVSPSGISGLNGEIGVVKEWGQGKGRVLVHGEWWHADSTDEVSRGDKIEVLAVNGMRLQVRKASES